MKNLLITALLALAPFMLIAQNNYDELQYLVVFEEGTPILEIEQIMQEHQAEEIWVSPFSEIRYWRSSGYPYYINNDLIGDIKQDVKRLKSRAKVTGGGLDYRVITFIEQAGGPNPITCFQNFEANSLAHSNSTIVSILDTGLSPNGIYGPQFTFSYGSYTGYDYISGDSDTPDDQGHGTHIAGIISHVSQHLDVIGQNQSDIKFDVRKVFDERGVGSISDIILGFDDAVILGAKVINMSFAYTGEKIGQKPDPLEYSILKAAVEEVLVVCASGNDNINNDLSHFPAFPASYTCDNILSVGSVNCNSSLSEFSNYGVESVDVTFLGEYIPGPSPTGDLVAKSGTSQATAVISGVAAAVSSYLGDPDYAKVKCAILSTVKTKSRLKGTILSSGIASPIEAASLAALDLCAPNHDWTRSQKQQEGRGINWSISPNPFESFATIKIESPIADNYQIQLLDLGGKAISTKFHLCEAGTNSIHLDDISSLESGTYIIRISSKKINEHRLIVKI